MIQLLAFEPFLAHENNAELVAVSKFGVLVLTGGEWVPTEILESDFANYDTWNAEGSEVEGSENFELAAKASPFALTHAAWPLVLPA